MTKALQEKTLENLTAEADRVCASTDYTLSESNARLQVANDYGFLTWRQLETYFTIPNEEEDDFQKLSCLTYFSFDRPRNRERARELLTADPSIAMQSIYSAAIVGDVDQVRRFLDSDPDLVSLRGGYFDWEPMLYACYARLDLPGYSTLEVARLLLERGADPNSYYMWGGNYRFTALTGAFGEGEMRPVNQPAHERWDELAHMLLDAGADPNDGQALYNRMFQDGHRCLEILFKYGLGKEHKINWGDYQGDKIVPFDISTLNYQLEWAIRNNHIDRAKLIADHGVELDRLWTKTSPYELCVEQGQTELAEYLVGHGAPAADVSDLQRFTGLCFAGDSQRAEEMLKDDSSLMRRLQRKRPQLLDEAASENRVESVAVLLDLGFQFRKHNGVTPLHSAAWSNRAEVVQLMLDRGADRSIRDDHHGSTPLVWSQVAGAKDAEKVLAVGTADVFDAISANDIDRIRELIAGEEALLETPMKAYLDENRSHSDDWMTPLAFAALAKKRECTKLLLSLGASKDIVNHDGESLQSLAEAQSIPEISELLGDKRPLGR